MRVISGTARGTKLHTCKDRSVRPTTDRVKESIFNILQFRVPDAVVLDLFCGSGALAVEALSRGATRAVLVDAAATSLQIAKENLQHTRLMDRAVLQRADWQDFLRRDKEQYDLVLADPPYALAILPDLLEQLQGHLRPGGVFLLEGSRELEPVERDGWQLIKNAAYGQTRVLCYEYCGISGEL